ncbi:MAG TPA: PadR family transcriptional regulator [Thermobifida alba]|nr:PadR family transcriptional regulator [Thermobifida alba]
MRLREQSYLVLLALTDGPRHGYAITTTVRELSEERVRLGAGTLYGALDRLADQGLVAVAREEVVNGRNRRYYELTEQGRRVLAEETERMARMARLARTRLLAMRPGWGTA